MIDIVCAILVVIDAGGVNILHKMDVEGTIINTTSNKYYVDFSKGIEKRRKQGNKIIGEDFTRLVDSGSCVKL